MSMVFHRKLYLIILFLLSFYLQAQYRVYHSVGDTVKFYGAVLKNSKKIDQWYIIDSVYSVNKVRMHAAKKYLLDTISGEFKLREQLNTPYFYSLRREGLNIFYGVNSKKTAEGMRKSTRKIGLWTYWYPDGTKKFERYYEEYKDPLSRSPQKSHIVNFWNPQGVQTVINGNGSFEEVLDNGTVLKGTMFEAKKDSIWSSVSKKGRKIYVEKYDKGTLLTGTSWDEDGTQYSYKKVHVNPELEGGRKKLVEIIQKHFKVPKYASENGIGGLMIVRFDIDTLGKIKNIQMKKKLCEPCDKMAMDVVKKLKSWKPAVKRGKKIEIKYSLPLVIKYNE